MKISNFQQSIDSTRPHSLLTPDVKKSGSLEYRYEDDQTVILVPNIWYNQPYQARVESVRFHAKIKAEAAEALRRHPPLMQSPEDVGQIVDGYLAQAARIHSEADRMESAGVETHPVAASLMELEYGS